MADKITTLNNQRGIEDVLFEKGLINQDQLSAIKFEQVNTGNSSAKIIKDRGFVSNTDYVKAYGELYGIEYIDLRELKIDQALLESIPGPLAKKHKVVPFELIENNLKLAMADPLDLQTIEFIERKTGHHVIPYIAGEKELDSALEEHHGKAIGEEISAALEEIEQTTLKLEGDSKGLDSEATIRDAPIARIVGMILETAVKTGASDIHLEPGEDKTRLRYRIDGILEEKRTIPKEMHDSIAARIKILSKMKIDEKRVPQDGRFKVVVGDTQTDLRVSTLPTIYGEKVVIRLLKEEGKVLTFKDLGMRGIALKRFEEAILKPTGMILVTGPTGSGKTVTLASALHKLNTIRVNIVTLEDPVEIRVPGVNQVQVNPQAGLTFANGLRSFLRQDPNIIMVGEIRDGETAQLAVNAALTGHLVLATLHTNSAAGAIPRLLDMGVENFLLASTINVILAQRLVRKLNPECREEYDPPEEIKDDIIESISAIGHSQVIMGKDKPVADAVDQVSKGAFKLHKGRSEGECRDNVYKGRTGIFEVLEISDTVSRMTMENKSAGEIHNKGVEEGMITLQQDGFLKAVEGTTSLEEVLRVSK